MLTVCAACVLAVSAWAAMPTPVLEWDVAASWDPDTGTVLNSGSLPAGLLKPMAGDAGSWADPPGWAGSPVDPARFGEPRYVPGGAGAGNRAYIDMEKYSWINLEGSSYTPKAAFGEAAGYTEIGYFYFSSGMEVLMNAGIGANHGWGNMDMFLYSAGSSPASPGRVLESSTVMYNPSTDRWWQKQEALTVDGVEVIPRNAWIQFVKVNDLANQEIRYYVNGELVKTTTYTDDLTGYTFGSNGDIIGMIGTGQRCMNGVGFSYLAAYDCVLTPEQIAASYAMLTTAVPEPATMTLLALGGLAMLRRRR